MLSFSDILSVAVLGRKNTSVLWSFVTTNLLCLHVMPILQFDYSGYLWAVGHLFCVGMSKNTDEKCYNDNCKSSRVT